MTLIICFLGAVMYRLQGSIKMWGDLLWGLSIATLCTILTSNFWIFIPVFLVEALLNQQWPHGNRFDLGAMPWKEKRDSFLTKDLPNTERGDLIAMARIGCARGIILGAALYFTCPAALQLLTVSSTLAFPSAYWLGKRFPYNIRYLSGPTERAEAYLGFFYFLLMSILL